MSDIIDIGDIIEGAGDLFEAAIEFMGSGNSQEEQNKQEGDE